MFLRHMIFTMFRPKKYLFTYQAFTPRLDHIMRIAEMLSERFITCERFSLKAERAVYEWVVIVPWFLHVMNHFSFFGWYEFTVKRTEIIPVQFMVFLCQVIVPLWPALNIKKLMKIIQLKFSRMKIISGLYIPPRGFLSLPKTFLAPAITFPKSSKT